MGSLVGRIVKKISSYKADRFTQDFISHNLRCFPAGGKSNKPNSPEVLFEFTWLHTCHIAYGYLANVLASKYGASIVAYLPTVPQSFWRRIEWRLSNFLSLRDFAIYRSFGTTGFFLPKLNKNQSDRGKHLSDQIFSQLKSKSDIEAIRIDGILLGDLIYDSYLRTFNRPTIEIEDDSFKHFLRSAISLYVFWDDYFREHDVRAINTSHCVYVFAIPLRIAINKNIPAFVVGSIHGYRLSKQNIMDSNDFHEYREIFQSLPVDIQKAGLGKAKQNIDRRFAGEVGVNMAYSTVSAFGNHKSEQLLKESSRTKILVATHCFFDSPHCYGNNLFPDFYEWMDFLGRMTLETDYDWYLKTHPDYLPGSKEVLDGFIKKYPQFHLLPSDSSHHQLIAEGINVALTCYGTIGFEYAALGVPVVNASLNNPHIAYDFNFHPKNVDEYRDILKNLDHIDLPVNVSEVYEFYFMKHFYFDNNWLFDDYNKSMQEVRRYSKQNVIDVSKVYDVWMREWTPEKHAKIIAKIDSWVDSESHRAR